MKEKCPQFICHNWVWRTSYDPYLNCDNCTRRVRRGGRRMMWNESRYNEDEKAVQDIKDIIDKSGLTMGRIFYLKEKLDELLEAANDDQD